jgi:hypothetical protein
MWTYLLGPFLAILPRPWRKALPFYDDVEWNRAGAISGLAESIGALIGASHWYSVAMSTWIANGVSSALAGQVGPNVEVQAIGSVALVLWVSHPLTWLLGYLGLEGAIRFAASAFSESAPAVFPLFLLDKIFFGAFVRRSPAAVGAPGGVANLSSIAGAVRERALSVGSSALSDELCFRTEQAERILEIRATRKKEGWTPPRVVHYDGIYYRLESESTGSAPRPFRYTLRRLPAGVPGRSVIQYAPSDAVVLAQK